MISSRIRIRVLACTTRKSSSVSQCISGNKLDHPGSQKCTHAERPTRVSLIIMIQLKLMRAFEFVSRVLAQLLKILLLKNIGFLWKKNFFTI